MGDADCKDVVPQNRPEPTDCWQLHNYFVDVVQSTITAHEFGVLMHLYRHADKGGFVTRSVNKIAKGIGSDRRNVIQWIKSLKKLGHLKIVCEGGPTHQPNRYQLIKRQEEIAEKCGQ